MSAFVAAARPARADGTWITPECTDASLESAGATCDGPWLYDWERNCNDPNICGYSTQCAQYASCSTYSFGIARSNTTENPSTQYTFTERETCRGPQWSDCTYSSSGSEPSSTCGSVASSRRASIVAGVPTTAPGFASWIGTFVVNRSIVTVSSTTTTQGGNTPNKPVIFTTTTKFKCQLNLVNRPSPAYGPAAVCGCAAFQPNYCICDMGSTFTPPAPNTPAPTHPASGQVFTSLPECTTCDDSNFNPESADPSNMMSCLQWGFGAMPADVRAAREARMKLLLQVAGHRMTAAERASVHAVYDEAAEGAPECSESLPIDPACAGASTAPDGTQIASQLQMCSDLSAPHVPSAVIAVELSHCVDVLAAVSTLPAGACRDSLRDVGSDVIGALIEHDAAIYDVSDGLEEELSVSLGQLDAWYEAVAPFSDADWLRARSSEMTGRIWKRAHEATLPLPFVASSDTAAAMLLADVNEAGLAVDWAMLRAAFDPSQPIDSPPLLEIVADALRGTNDRLDAIVPVHDTACRFAGCGPDENGGIARTTPVTSAFRAIGSLDDAFALSAALDDAAGLDAQHPELVSALTAVADNHAVLAMAWQRAGGGPIGNLSDGRALVPSQGEELAALVQSARGHTDSYDASGIVSGSRAHLSAAVLKQEQLAAFIDHGISQVDGAANAHHAARLATVNDLLEQTRAVGATQSVLDRAVAGVHQTRDLLGQLGGLRAREASEQASIGEFMSAFETVVESGAFDADAAYQIDVVPPVEIAPTDARHVVGEVVDYAALAAETVTLDAGEILDIDMLDQTWTPTCALSLTRIASPSGNMTAVSVDGATTGPEGFYLSWTNSSYRAAGFSSSHTYSDSHMESFEECGSFGAQFPPPGVDLPFPFSVSATYRNCSTDTWGYTNTHGTNTGGGNESRMSASFNSGLRLDVTPVPEAPVGSLLAVLAAHGHPDHVLDVRVVNRRDAIQAPALDPALGITQVDVHFLVNDITDPSCAPADDSLSLAMKVVTPAGIVARAVGKGMSQTLDEIAAQKPAILAQGGMTAYDAGELRTNAWARLTLLLAAHGYGLTGLPLELRNLYEAWIEQEIASLGRRGEMQRLQRELDRIGLEMTSLEHELANTQTQSRLLGLIPRWRLRDLSGVELKPALSALGEILSDYTAPIYDLRDPVRLSGFRTAAAAQLDQLVDVDFTEPLDEVAADLRLFAVSTRQSLVAAQFELPSTQRRTVVLAFPREPGACDGLCDEFRLASQQASERLWRGLEGSGHMGELMVQPADLYSFSGGNARLSCQDLAPVVRRASVYMLNPFNASVDLSVLGRELPATAGKGGARFVFPRSGGVVDFTSNTEAGVPLALPVINGPGGDVLTDFGTSTELGVGAGISPFSRFAIDFSSFYTDAPETFIDETLAVVLVLEVERRVSTDISFVPGVCQNVVAP